MINASVHQMVVAPDTLTFVARTESKEKFSIVVQAGKTYYVRNHMGVGVFVSQSRFDLVSKKKAERELENVRRKVRRKGK
jgi:outer membrane protein W